MLLVVEVFQKHAVERGNETNKLLAVANLGPSRQLGVGVHIPYADGERPVGADSASFIEEGVCLPNPVQVGK